MTDWGTSPAVFLAKAIGAGRFGSDRRLAMREGKPGPVHARTCAGVGWSLLSSFELVFLPTSRSGVRIYYGSSVIRQAVSWLGGCQRAWHASRASKRAWPDVGA